MKKLTTVLFLLVTLNGLSQSWAPTGAKWWYLSYSLSSGLYYASVESIGDTLIQGKNCKVLQSNGIGGCTYGSQMNKIITYADISKVFYFSQIQNKFLVLYDFSKMPGDTLYIHTDYLVQSQDSVGFVIDSVGQTTIDTCILKVQYVTALYDPLGSWVGHSGKIIERLGHSSFLFPIDEGSCDNEWTNGGILCYSDNVITYHDPNYSSGFCSTIGADEINSDRIIDIYPNPTNGLITISTDKDIINQTCVFDLFGRCVLTNKPSNSIDLSGLTEGVYILEILLNDNINIKMKIMKNASQ